MKKLLTILAFISLSFCASAQNTVKGDMDGDGKLSLIDIMLIVDAILNQVEEPESYLQCPDNNHPHLIDLGLPSGTKWSCCNVGAQRPVDFGDYYAWGDTEPMYEYQSTSYKYLYRDNDASGFWDEYTDTGYWHYRYIGKDISGTKYDVAHMEWGDGWVMPSSDQFYELIENCTSEYAEINKSYGRKFTGPNGGSIFLPFTGMFDENFYLERIAFLNGYYWSSVTSVDDQNIDPKDSNLSYMSKEEEVDFTHFAYCLFIDKKQSARVGDCIRGYGLSVRPVYRK